MCLLGSAKCINAVNVHATKQHFFLHQDHALSSCRSVRCSRPDNINTGGETDSLKYENMHVHTHISEWSMVMCQSTVTSEFQKNISRGFRLPVSLFHSLPPYQDKGKRLNCPSRNPAYRSLCSVTLCFKYTDRHCQGSGLSSCSNRAILLIIYLIYIILL